MKNSIDHSTDGYLEKNTTYLLFNRATQYYPSLFYHSKLKMFPSKFRITATMLMVKREQRVYPKGHHPLSIKSRSSGTNRYYDM